MTSVANVRSLKADGKLNYPAMRVLFIARVSPPYYSGAGRAMFQIARNLRRKGIGVAMLTARYDKKVAAYEVNGDVPVYRFMAPSNDRLARPLFHLQCALWLLFHPTLFNIIQFGYMPRYWLPVRAAASFLQKRVFIYMSLFGSDDLATMSRSRKGVRRITSYQKVQGTLAMTRKLINVSKKYLRDPSMIYHVPYPVNTKVFYPCANARTKTELRKNMGVGVNEKILVFVGAVIERKGIDLLVEAWPAVISVLPEARLYIIGPWANKEFDFDNVKFTSKIDKRIKELQIGQTLIFTGEKNEGVSDYLRLADLFVLPSRWEGLPISVLEAMASGLPCIVCKQPWLPDDLISHGETGLVCEPTPGAIADSILTVLGNQPTAEQMGIKARKVAEREYNPDVLTPRLIELYASSLR